MTKRLTAAEVKAILDGSAEHALIDVREEGVFGKSHLFLGSNLPLGRLEELIDDLVPRRATPIILVDGGEGLAERAADRLRALGYGDLAVLDGGTPAWEKAGFVLFSGVNVPSKAFGEFVEHAYDTPSVSAEELDALMKSGRRMVVLDSRPMDEFRVMSIPTGIDCPGAELVHRVHDIAPDPDTLVVVNCAGRTRSIIGAQSLRNAGIPNEVVALRNGTMGWHLAGLKLAHGEERRPPAPTPEGLAKASEAAERVARRFGVSEIDRATLARWRGERDARTLYVLDVRTPEEFAAGHFADARHAPGGQLVQATDRYVATRNARIVLVDDNLVRARMTASWLVQLEVADVHVLKEGLAGEALVTGPRARRVLGLDVEVPTVTPAEAKAMLDAGTAVVVDLQPSLKYRDGHIPGAWYLIRARMAGDLGRVPKAETLILTSPDGTLARLAVPEATALGRKAVALAGGTAAWEAAGLPTEFGMANLASAPEDTYLRPYDRKGAGDGEVEQAMRDYLTWEVDLLQRIERPGGARFRHFPG